MTTPTPYVLTLPPTDELIEKVARVLCGKDADEMTYTTMEPGVLEPYGPRWTHFIDDARNAVDAIRAIATPADATLPVAGYDGENSSSRYFFYSQEDAEAWAEQESGSIHECIRLTDAQAAIAAAGAERDAEIGRLRGLIIMSALAIVGEKTSDAEKIKEISRVLDNALAAPDAGATS